MESATTAAALPPAEVHAVPTSDGTEVRLTRYKFGTKGPLVLAPGYGNAARAFAIDTVPKNWVQYLGEHGYDVWLLDYRASPDLPSSFTQFTVDDIALRDWPAAIDTVRTRDRRRTRCRRWATASAACRCSWPIGGGMQGLRCGDVLARSPATRSRRPATRRAPGRGWRRSSSCSASRASTPTTTRRRWDGKADRDGDEGRCPFRHVYDNPVARRIYFIYGDVFDYENINQPTMEQAVPGFFGNGNITFFEHISLMIRASAARDARGADAYLANLDALQAPDQLHHRRAQQDVRAEGPAAHV